MVFRIINFFNLNLMLRAFLTTLLFFILSNAVWSQQSKAELEKEKNEIQKEINRLQSMYTQVKGQSKQSLVQLNLINDKIALQERYINSVNKEINFIENDIYRSNIEIYRLGKQLDTLKEQYAKTVMYAYKNRSNYDYINFIFSSADFNDALRRIRYLKDYRQYREKQMSNIVATQELIESRQKQQLVRKQEKSNALASQEVQHKELEEQKKEKGAIVTQLKSQEKELSEQLAVKKKRDRDIKNAITAVIKREIEIAKKEAAEKIARQRKLELERQAEIRKQEEAQRIAQEKEDADRIAAAKNRNTPNPVTNTKPNVNTSTGSPSVSGRPSSVTPATPATPPKPTERIITNVLESSDQDFALSTSFVNNKGRLPWPSDSRFVKTPFGRYVIEGTKLMDNNSGINLTAAIGSSVKAIFEGEVVAVDYKEVYLVVIKHGKYFTSYGNLGSVNVRRGDMVRTGQVIGKVAESYDDSGGELIFILSDDKKDLNPMSWLRP